MQLKIPLMEFLNGRKDYESQKSMLLRWIRNDSKALKELDTWDYLSPMTPWNITLFGLGIFEGFWFRRKRFFSDPRQTNEFNTLRKYILQGTYERTRM